jgi:hypothetical protein
MARVRNIVTTLGQEIEWHALSELQDASTARLLPPMVTLLILGGRKEKIRPGDVLGALTGEAGFSQGADRQDQGHRNQPPMSPSRATSGRTPCASCRPARSRARR